MVSQCPACWPPSRSEGGSINTQLRFWTLVDQSFHGSIVDMGVQGVINIWGKGGGVATFLKQCPVKLLSDTALCAFCQVRWPCGQKLKSKNTLSDGK